MWSKLIFLNLLLISGICFGDLDSQWQDFKFKFKKVYINQKEEALRKTIFANSLNLVDQHNIKQRNRLNTYEIGINEFSDMTDDEFQNIYLNTELPYDNLSKIQTYNTMSITAQLPNETNWIEYGYKNPILNQGKCGSCYTFGAIAAMEAHYFIQTKNLLQLSHQEVLDCSRSIGNNGCNGGYTSRTFQYALEEGIGYESNHPYLAEESECEQTQPRFNISGIYKIEKGNEDDLRKVVANIGPVAFGYDATVPSFKNYKSGIYYEPECTTNIMAHAMVVVGYGTEDGQDYWLIRNSWGESWGDKGYMKTARNKNNHCGIASRALFPIL